MKLNEEAERTAADLGVLYAAWWLHRGHGEDVYAADLLREWCGVGGIPRLRALARREQYRFRRGFWRKAGREESLPIDLTAKPGDVTFRCPVCGWWVTLTAEGAAEWTAGGVVPRCRKDRVVLDRSVHGENPRPSETPDH